MARPPKFRGSKVSVDSSSKTTGGALPAWVKCKLCGKPPIGSDWLKPVNPSPDCHEFIHLSHIPNGPQKQLEAEYILRNA